MSKLSKYIDVYNRDVVLPGSGETVTIKPLTTNLMKGLLIHENQTDPIEGEEIMDDIIEASVATENFSINDIYIQDKYFLFIEIRKLTKGDYYQFLYECPVCGGKTVTNVDLKDLKLTNMQEPKNSEVSILQDKVKLEMAFLTRGMQKEAYEKIKNISNENQKKVEMVLATLAQSITKIITEEGEEDISLEEKMEFIGELPESEYSKLNKWFTENDFGIDLNVNMMCNECGNKETDTIPLDGFFG